MNKRPRQLRIKLTLLINQLKPAAIDMVECLIFSVSIYLVFSFIHWDFNASHWSVKARCIFMIPVGLFTFGAWWYSDNRKKNNNG